MKNNLQQWQQPNSFSLSSSSQFSFSISSALTTQTLVNASEILSDFGYTSMALTLDLASQTLISSQSHSFTIFTPTEDPFSHSGSWNALRSKGCSVMASLLEMQFHGLLWSDLVSFNDGPVLRTNLMGFTNNITRSQDVLMLNGVSIILPEVYHNGWLSVHGISEVLEVPHKTEQVTVAPFCQGQKNPEEMHMGLTCASLTTSVKAGWNLGKVRQYVEFHRGK
ncbi:unnamed protein product [Prunus armeniaca]|uniref:FAS1 domain-containing protein n=1 Tax=Prunus armeniaca TaxID=36596 RepID=A0A6J5UC28_PRUAR|nr:unnamed protein product [Prunus armeniaca]